MIVRFLGPLVILGIWWWGSGDGFVSRGTLPSPAEVASTFWEMATDGTLWEQVRSSLVRAGTGLLIGGSIGLFFGVLSGISVRCEELFDSTFQMVRTVPFLALVPLFIVWMGIDETPKIALVALATTFPLYINTFSGVRNVDRRVVEAARTYGLGGPRLVWEVVIPLALPSILAGLRFATGISVLALIAAEQVNATSGIGYLMNQAQSFQETDVMVVCVLIYAALGLLGDLAVRLIEHAAMPWRAQVSIR